jgi:hypothetical protein
MERAGASEEYRVVEARHCFTGKLGNGSSTAAASGSGST